MPFHHYSKTATRQVTPYIYNFDKMRVKIFCQFAAHWLTYKKPMSAGMLSKRFGWSHSEYSAFSSIRHFGVVRKVYNPTRGKETNLYQLTLKGERFYCGEGTAPDMAVTFGGELLPPDHEAWNFYRGEMPTERYITDMDFEVKKHADWVAERKLALGIRPTLFS